MNYSQDQRVRAKHRWYETVNEMKMTATYIYHNEDGDEIEGTVPIKFEICPT